MTKVKLVTFGFKYGRPQCNHFIDVSWIPNPFRSPDKDPKTLVLKTDGVMSMINMITAYIMHISTKDRMIFGIGCSAGRDRSPIIANEIKKMLESYEIDMEVELEHRDMDR